MILSRRRGYLFVHIPKTGGTAMALALEDRAKADDILIGDTPKAMRRKSRLEGIKTRGRLWKHSTLADAEGLITPADMKTLFTFTLVRNPWDRLVSYYHWLQDQSFNHPAVTLAKSRDFECFLSDRRLQSSIHSSPYRSYMCDSARREQADLYIRLEHFRADVAPLEDHLGFDITLPQANASTRDAHYQSYYTPALARLVSNLCANDVSRFGYRFD